MSESERNRIPGEPGMARAEIRGLVLRVQGDLYFGPENVTIVLRRVDERFGNTATREDIANLKISLIKWYIGSIVTLTGIIVAVFKWPL